MSAPDAIRTAQAWLEHVAKCDEAASEGFTGTCVERRNLAALGPASVALAEALDAWHQPEGADCDDDDCLACKALSAWTEAVQSHD